MGFQPFSVQWKLKITIDVRPFRFELVAGLAVTAFSLKLKITKAEFNPSH
jgi:hypothetical protein